MEFHHSEGEVVDNKVYRTLNSEFVCIQKLYVGGSKVTSGTRHKRYLEKNGKLSNAGMRLEPPAPGVKVS